MAYKIKLAADRRKKKREKYPDTDFRFYPEGSDAYYELMEKQDPERLKREVAANKRANERAFKK